MVQRACTFKILIDICHIVSTIFCASLCMPPPTLFASMHPPHAGCYHLYHSWRVKKMVFDCDFN